MWRFNPFTTILDYKSDTSGLVPYLGATTDVDLGSYNFTTTGNGYFSDVTLTGTLTIDTGLIVNGSTSLTSVSTGVGDNDKLVTQGYVDDAVAVENLWDRAGTVLSTHTANDSVVVDSALTLNLGATNKLLINATTVDHTDTDGVIDLNLETATANVVGVHMTTQLTGDVNGVSSMQTNVLGYASGGGSGNTTYGWRSQMFGNASDTNHYYIAVDANGQKDGGTSSLLAFNAGANFDFLLRSSSGVIQFDDYSTTIKAVTATVGNGNDITIQAGDAVTAGDGGNIILTPGDEAGGAGSYGAVGIGCTPTHRLDVQGNFQFTPIVAPTTAVTGALSGTAGNVDDGTHRYKVSYYDLVGETSLSASYEEVTVVDKSTSGQVNLTDIPISPNAQTVGRKIYRGKAGVSTSNYYYHSTIADNTTTTATDNVADADIGTADNRNRDNFTAGTIYKGGINMGFMGRNNFGLGQFSLNPTVNPTGYFNFALGGYALNAITSGGTNTAVGFYAGLNITTASGTTAIGSYACYSVVNGYDNTGVGVTALRTCSGGRQNVAIGKSALYTQGSSYSTAVGYMAGYKVSAAGVVAIGRQALYDGTSATGMTVIGYMAGYSPAGVTANKCTTSTYGTFIGYQSGLGSTTQRVGAIAIGYKAVVDAAYTCVIGGTGAQAVDLIVTKNLIVPKTSGLGIKVDVTTPTFGWRDMMGKLEAANTGASKPTLSAYKGNVIGYLFATGDEEYFTYHIPHDYVPGTDIHLHIHWSHISAIVTGGTAVFSYEFIYAKGFNQAAYGTNFAGTITGTASTTQYQHITTEVVISAATATAALMDKDDLEPDGLIKMTIGFQTNNITSSGAVPDVFIDEVDVHYQSTNISTKDKAPDFYT